MEAALRTAYKLITGEELEDVNVSAVRGMEGVRSGEIDIKGTKLKVAIAHGMANVSTLLEEIREAKRGGQGCALPFHRSDGLSRRMCERRRSAVCINRRYQGTENSRNVQ